MTADEIRRTEAVCTAWLHIESGIPIPFDYLYSLN